MSCSSRDTSPRDFSIMTLAITVDNNPSSASSLLNSINVFFILTWEEMRSLNLKEKKESAVHATMKIGSTTQQGRRKRVVRLGKQKCRKYRSCQILVSYLLFTHPDYNWFLRHWQQLLPRNPGHPIKDSCTSLDQ